MRKLMLLTSLFLGYIPVQATDIYNRDNQTYHVKVQSEGKLGISFYDVKANTSMYGLCVPAFCSFAITGSNNNESKEPGTKITATRDEKLVIRNGKFEKM